MTPKTIVKLYEFLCTNCRYYWVYEGKTTYCSTCMNGRFNQTLCWPRIHTSNITIFEDFETKTIHIDTWKYNTRKGKAVVMFGFSGPHAKENFDDFIHRVDFVFGRFFTDHKFIGTSIPRYELFNTSFWIFTP